MKFNSLRDFLTITLASFFFIGFLPLIPGTFGSLAGVGLFYFINKLSWQLYLSIILWIALLGLVTAGRAEKILNKKDPRSVVIDEVMGMLIALYSIAPDIKFVTLGFILFRLFDTLKPYPAQSLQNLAGAWGIMADDLVAGIYTNIILQILINFPFAKAV